VPNDDIIVTSVQYAVVQRAYRPARPIGSLLSSQQRFVSGVVVCQLVCRLAVDILNIIFGRALSICILV